MYLLIWFLINIFMYPPQGVFLFSVIKHKPVKYLDYEYPTWGELIGWIMALSSILVTPIYAVWYFLKTPGTFREVKNMLEAAAIS